MLKPIGRTRWSWIAARTSIKSREEERQRFLAAEVEEEKRRCMTPPVRRYASPRLQQRGALKQARRNEGEVAVA